MLWKYGKYFNICYTIPAWNSSSVFVSNQAIKILRKKQTYETQAKISELWDKYDTEVLDDNEFIATVSQFMAFKV